MTTDPGELLKGTTPGPWKVKKTQSDLEVILSDGFYVHLIDDADSMTPEDVANARLIAAAPDLARRLEEAEAIVRVLDFSWPELEATLGDGYEAPEWWDTLLLRAEDFLTGKPKEAAP